MRKNLNLDSEFGALFDDSLEKCVPVIMLDTGGVIDIVANARKYDLIHRSNPVRSKIYSTPSLYLKELYRNCPVVIIDPVYREIEAHQDVRLNNHQLEIDKESIDVVREIYRNSGEFLDRTNLELSDDVRYEMSLVSEEACRHDLKKYEEGCSAVDNAILSSAAQLSNSSIFQPASQPKTPWEIRNAERIRRDIEPIIINPVIIMSGDKHLKYSIDFINSDPELKLKYPNIGYRSTR